jgi:hypothetical protein
MCGEAAGSAAVGGWTASYTTIHNRPHMKSRGCGRRARRRLWFWRGALLLLFLLCKEAIGGECGVAAMFAEQGEEIHLRRRCLAQHCRQHRCRFSQPAVVLSGSGHITCRCQQKSVFFM